MVEIKYAKKFETICQVTARYMKESDGQKKLAHDKNFPKDLENAFQIGKDT